MNGLDDIWSVIDPEILKRRAALASSRRIVSPPIPTPSPVSAPPDIRATELPVGAPPLAAPVAPPLLRSQAIDSASQRYQQALESPPRLTGWKKGLDIAGQLLVPGLEARIPGTPGYHRAYELPRLAELAQREQIGETREAELGLKRAQIEREKAQTEKLRQPPTEKAENLSQEEVKILEHLVAAGIPEIDALRQLYQARQKEPPEGKPSEEDKAIRDYLAANKLEDTPVNRNKARSAIKTRDRPVRAPTEFEEYRKEHPTATVEDFMNAKQGLTTTTRAMIESAPGVNKFVDRIEKLVQQEANQLGPLKGRWNEFWAGRVGAPNSEYVKLRTDVGLLQTRLMRMHVGARGGVEMLAHFKALLDQGKQSPENMLAALNEIRAYANDLIEEGKTGRGRETPPGEQNPLGLTPPTK